MRVIHGIQASTTPPHGKPFASSVVTIGNFDGVHLGHRVLLEKLVARAKTVGGPSVVFTFDPHPVQVLHPGRKLHRIFSIEDQVDQMARLGVDLLVIEPFSREFSQLKPEQFLVEWIYKPFVPAEIIVGYDFSFGANRQGSIDFLQAHASNLGFDVEVVPPFKIDEMIVSSSRIRGAIEDGDVALAHRMLGRSFYLRGIVERGAGRGRTIGFPTANLHFEAETIPKRGVYAALAHVQGRRFAAAVNIGLNPTFVPESSSSPLSMEAHLIGFSGDLYGENLKLEFLDRIRDEQKFASPTELIAQIHRDVKRSEELVRAAGVLS
jgi:riboflavin kinase / FMN adenylyltransferase